MARTRRRPAHRAPWVPNQHGAWAMLLTPLLLGSLIELRSSPGAWPTVLAIAIAWVFGYFAFFATGVWWKTRNPQRRREAFRPVLVYSVIAALGSLSAIIQRPSLLWWSLAFAPLVAIAVAEILARRPRSLTSGVATTLASSLLVIVPSSSWVAVPPAVILALYFTGTIPYVKTMIRERNNPRFYLGSVLYHWVAAALIAGWWTLTLLSPWGAELWSSRLGLWSSTTAAAAAWAVVLLLVIAAIRATVVPRLPGRISAKQIGVGEIPLTLAFLLACALL